MAEHLHFDFFYWIGELIDIGKKIQPEKYTQQYQEYIVTAWGNKPMTQLHQMCLSRRREFEQLKLQK